MFEDSGVYGTHTQLHMYTMFQKQQFTEISRCCGLSLMRKGHEGKLMITWAGTK